jgi:hypothetical protein
MNILPAVPNLAADLVICCSLLHLDPGIQENQSLVPDLSLHLQQTRARGRP